MRAFPRAKSRTVVLGYRHLSRMGQGQKVYLAIMNETALVNKAVKVRQVILKVISNLQKIRGSLTIRVHLYRVNKFREILIGEGKGVIRLGGGGHRTGGDGGALPPENVKHRPHHHLKNIKGDGVMGK